MPERMLVDACCGPCSLVLDRALGVDREGVRFLFFNPNIHPFREYRRRLEAFTAFMQEGGFGYEVPEYRPEEWLRAVSFREEDRCEMCYRLRLGRAAAYAAAEGFPVFTTTLLASPHQDHEMLRRLGESAAAARGLRFLEWDGRAGYREGLKEARESGLYLQPWCGCIFSERERYDRGRRGAGGP